VEVLVSKAIAAANASDVSLLTLRAASAATGSYKGKWPACRRAGLQFLAAAPSLSTDNAAMIAFAAALRIDRSFRSNVADEIDPNLALA